MNWPQTAQDVGATLVLQVLPWICAALLYRAALKSVGKIQ